MSNPFGLGRHLKRGLDISEMSTSNTSPLCSGPDHANRPVEVFDEALRNVCNDDAIVSTKINEYFSKYPHSSAKLCCGTLGLEYERYGRRARKIRHDLKLYNLSIVPVTNQNGRGLKPHVSSHRVEYGFRYPVSVGFIMEIEEKAQLRRAAGAWYRSSNRNRQLEYFDDDISIRIYPKSGTCRILPHRVLSFDELRVKVEDVLAKALPARTLLSEAFDIMIRDLQVAKRHLAFYTGPITPFKNNSYRDSLGLGILADGSHPEHLEIHENWPAWIPPLFEFQRNQASAVENNTRILSEFALQIKSHLDAVKAIGGAADRLNEVIQNLAQIIRDVEPYFSKK